MKQLGRSVYRSIPRFYLRITLVLIILNATATTQAQSLIPELSFKNPVLETGKADGQDGAVYLFENVGWGIDALLTILGRSCPEVTLSHVDIQGPEQNLSGGIGDDNAWQPGIRYRDGTAPAHQSWWMEFKISFIRHADPYSFLHVNQFFVSGLDIDGDGNQLHEFQTYFKMHSFTLDNGTAIYATSVLGSRLDPMLSGKRFDGPKKNYKGISVTAEDAMVGNYYFGSSSMIVRLGAETGTDGSKSADRMFGLLFKSLTYDIPEKNKESISGFALNQNSWQPK